MPREGFNLSQMKIMLTLLSNCPYARPSLASSPIPFPFLSLNPYVSFAVSFCSPSHPSSHLLFSTPGVSTLSLLSPSDPFVFFAQPLSLYSILASSDGIFLFVILFSLYPFSFSFFSKYLPFSAIFPSVSPTLPCNCVPFLLFPINYLLFPLLSVAVPIIV